MKVNLIGEKIIVSKDGEETILKVTNVFCTLVDLIPKDLIPKGEIETGLQYIIIGNVESSSISDVENNISVKILVYSRTSIRIIHKPSLFNFLRFVKGILSLVEKKLTTKKWAFFYFKYLSVRVA